MRGSNTNRFGFFGSMVALTQWLLVAPRVPHLRGAMGYESGAVMFRFGGAALADDDALENVEPALELLVGRSQRG
jgi:hypothetical protein